MRYLIVIALYLTTIVCHAESADPEKAAMLKRIKPVGEVYIAGETPPPAAVSKDTKPVATVAKTNGKDTYDKYCAVCHTAGIAGAPVKNDKKAWSKRSDVGIAGLVTSAVKGLNAMPAKGTCASCSNDELKAAILYMLPKDLLKK